MYLDMLYIAKRNIKTLDKIQLLSSANNEN